ncbi:MAG: putative spermidine/putrescine transport system permease protein [Solirubrobacteraceae bacterium]|nr:putative spermidine/putrescine transport system permease protein [Solirubrobacteraceae bacterium]
MSQVVATGARGASASRAPATDAQWRWGLLLVPAVAFVAIFFLVPLGEMVSRSLTEPGPANYTDFFEAKAYVRVLGNTFKTALLVTVICVVLGYPYAYAMRRAGRWGFALLSVALLLPFWSSLLVRTFAWMTILQDTGVINDVLTGVGIVDEPVELIRNQVGVVVGMTHIMLPYMVLPLYAVMTRIDLSLTEAAGSLGASPLRAFRRVFLPLSVPGLTAGALLVFVLCLGFYITPALLGGPKDVLIGQLIADQVSVNVNFGFASAIGIVLLVLTLLVLGVGARLLRGALR